MDGMQLQKEQFKQFSVTQQKEEMAPSYKPEENVFEKKTDIKNKYFEENKYSPELQRIAERYGLDSVEAKKFVAESGKTEITPEMMVEIKTNMVKCEKARAEHVEKAKQEF